MKNQVAIITTLITLIALFSIPIHSVRSQPYYDGWFTHIYVTNVNDKIDLINGGTAKVYEGQDVLIRLVFYNDDMGTFGADLYTKVFRAGELVGTSSETNVGRGRSETDYWSATLSEVATYSFKVELWWEDWGDHLLVDVREFEIEVVKLEVSNWAPSPLSVERGFESGDLSVAFTNEGYGDMYNVNVSVLNSAGLTVTPQEQNFGSVNEGETRTAHLSVEADEDKTPKNYIIVFEVIYDDIIGTAHTETFEAEVIVTSNFIRENLFIILLVIIVIAGSIVASITYVKLRKPKEIKV